MKKVKLAILAILAISLLGSVSHADSWIYICTQWEYLGIGNNTTPVCISGYWIKW
jgi:hypothetical protein